MTPHLLVALLSVLLIGQASISISAEDFTPINTQAAGEHPLPPAEAIRRLWVPDGFQVTLAAAEPDVRQPIAIAFDDRGRLWVAESYSYNGSRFTDDTHDRILIFEDSTGDGVLDRRKVFCDGLTHLTGLELGFGGVWIAAPPNLAFIPDLNADDAPDGQPIVRLDGWSLKAEHNSVNGLTWGPDGWLYGRHGIKQPSLVGRPGTPTEQRVELSCAIWRYHPTRHVFEVVTDGTINPWGLDFDDQGHGFLTTSVVEHLWHLVPGAHYERWKNRGAHPDPFVYEAMTATSDHLHWGSGTWDKAGRMADGNNDFGGGHSHCDAMIYLGDRWPEMYRGSLFTSNIHGRRINRDQLVRDGGPFRGEHEDDFLVAADPWFRAVSLEYGPDGDVYLTDWSDNGECHDRDGVHRTSGRIYKVSWGDPIRTEVNLASASNGQLVEYQLHRNDWFVRHARRLLHERAASGQNMAAVHEKLRAIFDTNPDVTRQLRALWTLDVTDGAGTDWLVTLLNHDSEHVRAWAVRLLVDSPGVAANIEQSFGVSESVPTNQNASASFAADSGRISIFAGLSALAAKERSWLVRMELASGLRRLAVDRRLDIATQLVSQNEVSDPNLDRMIWYAVQPAVAADPGRGLMFAAVASQRLRQWVARRLAGHSHDAVTSLFAAAGESPDPAFVADLLTGFSVGLETLTTDDVPASVRDVAARLIDHPDERVRVPALTVAAAIGDEAIVDRIRQVLHDGKRNKRTRLAALAGVANRGSPGLADDLRRLIAVGQLTLAALQASGDIHDPALLATILARYPEMKPDERSAAIDVFTGRAESADQLLAAVERREIPAADLSAAQARQIATLNDRALLRRLEAAWGTVRSSSVDRVRRIRELEEQLTPGNLSRADLAAGRDLFRKTCSNCHRLFGDGRTIGPELTGANRRNLLYLISNIVDPSAAVPADFRQATVITNGGRIITGAISQRTELALTIQTANGEVRVRSDDVDEVAISSQSMMPDGLLDRLTRDQTRDLIAWLMSDGVVAASSAANSEGRHAVSGNLPLVILLGDSIRMNYQQQVIADLQGRAEVWAPQENGHHSAFTLVNLDKWIGDRRPAVVHMNVGLHDMFLNAKTGKPRHDVETYSRNLLQIFQKLNSLTDARIIFALTTPVDEQRQAASTTYGRVVRRSADIKRYNLAARAVAKSAGVAINDLDSLARQVGPGEILRESDGIHLSEYGQQVIGHQVAAQIKAALNSSK
jgi:putative membrane-bound dehydrogenase-like protein